MTHYWSLQDIPWFNYRQYVTSITVYWGVTALGHHAFYDCPNVTTVSIYSDLTSIGVLSFAFCRKLTTLEIPNSVTSIGDQALWYNESLKEVHVKWTGDAVPTMPSNIHNFEASQIRLHIPCGQTAAYVAKGWNTKFALVEGLYIGTMETTTNYFPWVLTCDSVWTVSGTGALNDFPNPMYAVVMDIRVTVNGSKLSPVFAERNTVKGAVFEEGITYIGNNTFYKGTYHSGYPYLTTLTLPSTLTSMSSTAFKGCIALKDVYVSWTTAAAIPTWNQTIDVSQATLHVPCGTTALYQAKGWQNFIIREEPYRGTCGAQGDNLTWSLSCDGTLTISGTGAMVHYWAYEDIPWWNYRGSIQRIVIEEGVTTIGNHAFVHCSNLTSVSLPNTLTAISVLAFGHCTSLPTLVIPSSVTSMAGMFIHNTPSLTDVYVSWTGDAVPDMPADIHPHDASQKRLHIPCGQAGAYYAKGWNTKFTLPDVVSGTCGDNVQWTFESCNGTLTIFGTGAMKNYPNPAYHTVAGISIVTNRSSLSPFWGMMGEIKEAVFEEGITYIGKNTFYRDQDWTGYPHLTSLTLPSTLTSMSSTAFKGCVALKDVYVSWTTAATIPTWNQSIDVSQATLHVPCGTAALYQAAEGWQDYTIVEDDSAHGTCGADGDNLTWNLCDGTLTISGTGGMYNWMTLADRPWHSLCTSIQRIVIEEGVTTTGYHAFYGASNLTSVSLPSTLQTLQFMTFFGCSKLTTLTIPSSVTYVGTRSLEGCSALTDVYMSETGDAVPTMPPGIHTYDASRIRLHIPCGQAGAYFAKGWNTMFTIDGVVSGTCGDNVQWTFESCNGTLSIFGTGPMADYDYKGTPWYPYRQSITSITIANGVTGIGEWAFHGCNNLTSVTIPSNVTNIGGSAFYYCISLTSITIPNSVINISDFAFYHCTALSSISIPNSVTSIGIMAFSDCTSLSSISISNSVTSIGMFAFDGCTSLTSVTIPNSVTSIGFSLFGNCNSLTDIYVSWTSAIPAWGSMTNNDPQSGVTLHVPCSAMSLYKAAEGWKDYTIEGEGGPYTITVESDDPTMGTVDAVKIGE